MNELAPYVRILGRGPGRSRNMTETEAFEAMQIILQGECAREAVGGLLMLMRYRGEEPQEIAGFVRAFRETLPEWSGPRPGLDWPTYAAGRSRGLPWFLLSARLVAQAGVPVLLHGWNSHQTEGADVRGALPHVGIAKASGLLDAQEILARDGIAYLPLEDFAPQGLALLKLRDVLGVRSCINTCMRVMNPAQAAAQVQGVFHPPYLTLQAEASALLGQQRLSVLKGGGGEYERNPAKPIALHGLRDGQLWNDTAQPILDVHQRLSETDTPHEAEYLTKFWYGSHQDDYAKAIVLGTAALALEVSGTAQEGAGLDLARSLWEARPALHTA